MKRIFVALTIALTLAVTMTSFAQGQRGQRPNPAAALKNALNLTDAQVASIQALFQANQQQAQTIMADVKQKRQALDALLNATSPNPADVGNAAIAMHTAEKQLQALHAALIADVKNQLTTDQQATLETLLKAGAMLPGLGGGFGGPRGMRGPRGNN